MVKVNIERCIEDCLDVKVYLRRSNYIAAHDRRNNNKGLCWMNVPGRTIYSFGTTQICGKWFGKWYRPEVVIEGLDPNWHMPAEMTIRDLISLTLFSGNFELYKCRVSATSICLRFLFSDATLFKWKYK